jgi:hypothetical protein
MYSLIIFVKYNGTLSLMLGTFWPVQTSLQRKGLHQNHSWCRLEPSNMKVMMSLIWIQCPFWTQNATFDFPEVKMIISTRYRHLSSAELNSTTQKRMLTANLPKKMLAILGKVVGTLKRTMPATDSGILFNDPTKLKEGHKNVRNPCQLESSLQHLTRA